MCWRMKSVFRFKGQYHSMWKRACLFCCPRSAMGWDNRGLVESSTRFPPSPRCFVNGSAGSEATSGDFLAHHELNQPFGSRPLPSCFFLLCAHSCLGLCLSGFRTACPNLLTHAPQPLLHFEHHRAGMPDHFACHLIQAPAYCAHLAPTPGLG